MRSIYAAIFLVSALTAPGSVVATEPTEISPSTGLGNCSDLAVISAYDYSKPGHIKTEYRFNGSCNLIAFVEYPGGGGPGGWFVKPVQVRVAAEFENGTAVENITIFGIDKALAGYRIGPEKTFSNVPRKIGLTYACGADPWINSENWKTCDLESVRHHEEPMPRVWPLWQLCNSRPDFAKVCTGIKQPYLVQPLSREAVPAVLAHIATKQSQPHPPLIVCPKRNQAYPTDRGLPVDVRYIDPELSFSQQYKYPSDANAAFLMWERWIPSADGTGGQWARDRSMPDQITHLQHSAGEQKPILCGLGGITATVDDKEGKWRIRAKHRTTGWPWTGWVEFWIGDKLDYSKGMATIETPKENQELAEKHLENGLYLGWVSVLYEPKDQNRNYLADIELEYFQADASKTPSGWGIDGPFRSQVMMVEDTYGPGLKAVVSKPLEKGLWRARARPRPVNLGREEPQHPWTPWRHFWAGEATRADVNALRLARDAMRQDSGESGGASRLSSTSNVNQKADLIIESFWVEEDQRSGVLYFNWLVRNVGESHAAESTLTVSCKQLGAVPCPWVGGSYSKKVKALAPAKEGVPVNKDFAAGEVISLGMDKPTAAAKFELTAVADSTNRVKEIDERNNHLVSNYYSAAEDRKALPRDVLKSLDPSMLPTPSGGDNGDR